MERDSCLKLSDDDVYLLVNIQGVRYLYVIEIKPYDRTYSLKYRMCKKNKLKCLLHQASNRFQKI